MTDSETQNGANEPQNSPSVPSSSQGGTEHQLEDSLNAVIENCKTLSKECDSLINSLRVADCALEGFSRAVDKFYAERSTHA